MADALVRLNKQALSFVASYEAELNEARQAAELARVRIASIVSSTGAFVQVVSARVKSPSSLRGKLRRPANKPGEPLRRRSPDEITDLIGVRVITYYRNSVDPIAERLKAELEIDHVNSVDKRQSLELSEFGYSSVHLIARLKSEHILLPGHQILRGKWFEIQIRSILEHAWAEIEHEVVYKSGATHSGEVKRRFSAIAGTLEMLDSEFATLRRERHRIIDEYRIIYENKQHQTVAFDSVRLAAYLEVARPSGRSWRKAEDEGVPFPAGTDVLCKDALKTVGLGTPRSLSAHFRTNAFKRAIRRFAAETSGSSEDVSHFAVAAIAVGTKNWSLASRHFPEIFADPIVSRSVS